MRKNNILFLRFLFMYRENNTSMLCFGSRVGKQLLGFLLEPSHKIYLLKIQALV